MMCRTYALAPMLVGALLVARFGCASAQVPTSPAVPGAGKSGADRYAGLTVRISTDKTAYAAGDIVKMTLMIRNTTRSDLQLIYNTGQKFDFELRRGPKPDGPALWQWSRRKMFTMMVRSEILKAGETQTFTAAYDPKSEPGHDAKQNGEPGPLSAGVYTITGTLTVSRPGERPHATTTIHVK